MAFDLYDSLTTAIVGKTSQDMFLLDPNLVQYSANKNELTWQWKPQETPPSSRGRLVASKLARTGSGKQHPLQQKKGVSGLRWSVVQNWSDTRTTKTSMVKLVLVKQKDLELAIQNSFRRKQFWSYLGRFLSTSELFGLCGGPLRRCMKKKGFHFHRYLLSLQVINRCWPGV